MCDLARLTQKGVSLDSRAMAELAAIQESLIRFEFFTICIVAYAVKLYRVSLSR